MQPLRFPATKGSPFVGNLIDRRQPIEFSFNGRSLNAYKGDTLLSALLANGCKSWRNKNQQFIPLNADSIRHIFLKFAGHSRTAYWHGDIELEDQMKLETVPAPSFLKKMGRTFSRSKEFHIEMPFKGNSSFIGLPQSDEKQADVVVVGGGISGLQAALRAAALGKNVTLFERTRRLGGMCDYYGQADDEEAPLALIERLANEVSCHELINVELCVEVLDVRPGRVFTLTSGSKPEVKYEQHIGWTNFQHLVLAVGADYDSSYDPKLGKTQFANQVFRMAADYGVMPASQLCVITGGNSGYRLAQLLLESGITIDGLYDPRTAPTSRHIDFAKAVGVRMHLGENANKLETNNGQIEVEFGNVHISGERKIKRQFGDLILSNAPKPNLEFWVRAGGNCQLNADGALSPKGNLVSNTAIVGSASGSISQEACLTQANHVVDQLLNQDPDQSAYYVGMYKYESPAQTLELNDTQISINKIREEAQVPAFSPQPDQHAISEYLFERSGLKLTIEQMRKSNTISRTSDVAKPVASIAMTDIYGSRFNKPIFVNIQALGYLNLAVGQVIYDGDGVNQQPNFYGVVVEQDETMKALIEGDCKEQLAEAFVQTRSGLFVAKLGPSPTAP